MEEKTVIRSLAALAQEVRLRVFRALVVAGTDGMTPGALAALLDVPASTFLRVEDPSPSGTINYRKSA